MPASLSDLITNRARLTHTLDNGESFFIDYKPAQLTPRQMHLSKRASALAGREWEDLSEAERDEMADAMDTITHMLANTLIATDLLDAQGRPIVCTYEGLQDVTYAHQTFLLDLIQEDQKLPKANGTAKSPASSSGTLVLSPTDQEATSHRSPNGTHSARSPRGGKRR